MPLFPKIAAAQREANEALADFLRHSEVVLKADAAGVTLGGAIVLRERARMRLEEARAAIGRMVPMPRD